MNYEKQPLFRVTIIVEFGATDHPFVKNTLNKQDTRSDRSMTLSKKQLNTGF